MKLASGGAFKALLVIYGLAAVCGLGLGDIAINEVELSPPDSGTVWVELYNTGGDAVDLTGWLVKIEDKPWTGSISLSGIFGPGEFYVAEGQPNWVAIGNGEVYLLNSAGAVVDKAPQLNDKGQNDFTYGRFPDGKESDTRADFMFMMGSKGRSNRI